MLAKQWIYEHDPKDLRTSDNPHGVGKLFGQVVKAFDSKFLTVRFYDAKKKKWLPESLKKCFAKSAPPVGWTFCDEQGITYTITKYTAAGYHVKQ